MSSLIDRSWRPVTWKELEQMTRCRGRHHSYLAWKRRLAYLLAPSNYLRYVFLTSGFSILSTFPYQWRILVYCLLDLILQFDKLCWFFKTKYILLVVVSCFFYDCWWKMIKSFFASFSQEHNINLSQIESRPSKRNQGNYEFLVVCEEKPEMLNTVLSLLKKKANYVHVLSRSQDENTSRVLCKHPQEDTKIWWYLYVV